MDLPVKPRKPELKKLPELPPQFIYRDKELKVEKTVRGTKIQELSKLANKYTYVRASYDMFDCAIIELGNTITPAGEFENPKYIKALEAYNEIVYDNECRMFKYEQDMIKYRQYVEKYRAWREGQKNKVHDELQ